MQERMSATQYRETSKKAGQQPKYRNTRIAVDGVMFDSKAEAQRYQELKLLVAAKKIFNLELQPKFELVPKTKKRRAVTYTADFMYKELQVDDICMVVEDVKSPVTAKNQAYIIKRNLFEYRNPDIEFREIVR